VAGAGAGTPAGAGAGAAREGSRVTWRQVVAAAVAGGLDREDARRMLEALDADLDDRCTALALRRFETMVERRRAGEPLQYALGSWGFRTLDLLVDRRVLIPRPETEWVVEEALRRLPADEPALVVDLGTGSGAVALSVAVERPRARVVATDASADALAVARANLAGIGRAAARVTLHAGDWWEAVPVELRGQVDLVVSNPPYVAAGEALPPEVAEWEPAVALVPGPTGLEALAVVVGGAPDWLRPGGWLVCEIGETQGDAVRGLASTAGLVDVDVLPDLTGRDRVLVARR
jgi:release factor glutamine methyltransferase